MTAIRIDNPADDQIRREQIYSGEILVLPPTPISLEFCHFVRALLGEAFGTLDPQTAQYSLAVERYARVLAELKPKFIHHPESKRLVRGLLRELGCDPNETYFDVPRLRSSTSDNYLTTGIAYAFHPAECNGIPSAIFQQSSP
jgi:hypothetical protein